MVKHQRKWCRFSYLFNAIFQPSKIKLVLAFRDGSRGLKNVPNEWLFTFASTCERRSTPKFPLSTVLHWHRPFHVSLVGIENISICDHLCVLFYKPEFRSQTWMVLFCRSVNSEGLDTFRISSIISIFSPNPGKTLTIFKKSD